MTPLIEFHFYKSRAKDYPDLISRCKHFESFTQAKEPREKNKLVINSVNELMNNWPSFMAIATRVPLMVGSQGWFMGDEIVPFKPDFFYQIQDAIEYCYRDYRASNFQDEFCNSDWGCRKLSSIQKHINPEDRWTFHMHWYKYGHFEGDKWVIDKGAIMSILKKEAENNYLEACPVFDFKNVEKAVAELPNEIELNDNWQILTRTELKKDGFIEVPFSIAPAWIEPEKDDPAEYQTKSDRKLNIKDIDTTYLTNDEINDLIDLYRKHNR